MIFFKATQAAHVAEEWVDRTMSKRKKEEAKHYVA